MINVFNANDMNMDDEISISIYSDVIGSMFKCGNYKFRAGDLVDFGGLEVPCRSMVTLTLTEHDML